MSLSIIHFLISILTCAPVQLEACSACKLLQGLVVCRSYSFGDSWFAEVDIVLPADMSVAESHDIAEELQIKLERLPDIARAFVHIDFETTHVPEHKMA